MENYHESERDWIEEQFDQMYSKEQVLAEMFSDLDADEIADYLEQYPGEVLYDNDEFVEFRGVLMDEFYVDQRGD